MDKALYNLVFIQSIQYEDNIFTKIFNGERNFVSSIPIIHLVHWVINPKWPGPLIYLLYNEDNILLSRQIFKSDDINSSLLFFAKNKVDLLVKP